MSLPALSGCSTSDSASDEQPGIGQDASEEDASEEVADAAIGQPEDGSADAAIADEAQVEAALDGLDSQTEAEAASPCPEQMTLVGSTCVDLFEAPNVAGALPLVMLHFDEAESWCASRGKRLCFDDEWTAACEGPQATPWPYGDQHDPGVCNDDKAWKAYNQTLLNAWPWSLQTDSVTSLDQLLDAARAQGSAASAAADHVEAIYQATPSGAKTGCVGPAGVFDLTGNVEEWTRRRDGGSAGFHGNLKGRYWAEARTCQQGVITHGDTFRFYEIGFRCCSDPL